MQITQEQFVRLEKATNEALRKLDEATALIETQSKIMESQANLIKHLSEDNLKLVAKLDVLTGKNATGKAYEA